MLALKVFGTNNNEIIESNDSDKANKRDKILA